MASLIDTFRNKQLNTTPSTSTGGERSLVETIKSKNNRSFVEPFDVEEAEQPLPQGAISRDPFGNPYFGEGLAGMAKKWWWNATKEVDNVTDDEWDDLWKKWRQASHIEMNVSQKEGTLMQVGLAFETASKLWQDMTQDGSILSPGLKTIGATITLATDLFGVPAQKVEQAFGAAEGFREAANTIESPLPNLDDTFIGRLIENLPVGLAYDAARIALSPSQNKWEYTRQKIEDGWQSGRIFYTTLFDRQKKEEFLQRYHAGEDPALLAMELGHWLAEGVGQAFLDPLNIVGLVAKGAKTAKQLNLVTDSIRNPGVLKTEAGKAAFKLIQEATDDHTAARALNDLVAAQQEAVNLAVKKSRVLNVGYSLDSLTTSSRQNAVIGQGRDRLGNMAMVLKDQGLSYDGIAEGILAGIRSVSSNADEVRKGLAGIVKLPNANVWLTDDYIETFTVLNRMMTNADGVVDGGRLRNLLDVKDPVQFADEAEKLLLSAAKSEFNDVTDLEKAFKVADEVEKAGGTVSKETARLAEQYRKLPNYVKIANRANEAIKATLGKFNSHILFPAYFEFQGGPAMRNLASNLEMILLDKGPSAWFREGKVWTQGKVMDFLKDMYGTLPESAHGFKSLVASHVDRKPRFFGKLMEKGEEVFAARLVAASVRDTMDKMLPKALPNLAKAVENGTMTPSQVNKLQQLIRRNNYNVQKAVEEFRQLYKVGNVEEWRNLDYVTDFERQSLEAFDLMDEIEDLARNGAKSVDEIEERFARLNRLVDDRAGMAVHDPIGISEDHPGIEGWGDLARAVEDGHLSPDEHRYFTAVMEYQEQARLEYQTLLDDVGLKAIQALNLEGRVDEAAAIGNELNRVRDVLRRSGPATAKRAYETTQDAWRWTEEARAIKKVRPGQMAELWRRSGLPGEPPADLTKKIFLNELWNHRHEKVAELWNSSFDALVGESETVLRQLEEVIDATELKSMATRTRYISKQAQAIRSGAFRNGALKIYTRKDIDDLAQAYNITPEEILQTINNRKGTNYQSVDDVETHDVLKIINERAVPGAVEPEGINVPPPHPIGTMPSPARVWHESATGLKYVLDDVKNNMLSRWGRMTQDAAISPEMEQTLADVIKTAQPRLNEAKIIAADIAREQRNFTLLNYSERTYLDALLTHVFPFQFYYRRSYRNWISRIATSPQIVANYGRYKRALEQKNKDLPDWFKQQLNFNPFSQVESLKDKTFLGIPLGHPLYVNLEATFNPIYGITGTDYYDRYKRTNWVTATIDDMNKFGPTIYAPIQLAIAAMLYMDGETDAAARWGSRLFPQTNVIKSTTALFGKPVELDPSVWLFSGGIDPYDRARMSLAVPMLLEEGYSMADIMAAFHAEEGEIWDKAYQISVESRAGSNLLSFFGGVGFKPRTEADVQVERVKTDLNQLYALSDMMTSEQFRMAQEQLRSNYPPGMVDAILLASKSGDRRDAAYAYNVLGRIPPGDMTELFASVGLSNDEIDKFYKSKGFTDASVSFTPQEKMRFMTVILDLGAMLELPDNPTRMEWAEVRMRNSAVTDMVKQTFGEDIYDKTDLYYDLKEDDAEAAAAYASAHPEIFAAQQLRRQQVLEDPLLSRYYASLSTIEMYYNTMVRETLTAEYGPEIYDLQTAYYDADNPRAFLAKYPELRRFWSDKRALEADIEPLIFQAGLRLEDGIGAAFQDDFMPQSPTQETLFDALQPQPKVPSWEQMANGMAGWLQDEIAAYAERGRPLSRRAENQLEYLADARGLYNGEQLLRLAVLSLYEGGFGE